MKRFSTKAIVGLNTGGLDSGRSAFSGRTGSGNGSVQNDHDTSASIKLTAAAHIASTAKGAAEGWVVPMAAEVLLMRGRLALLDGKLRVRKLRASIEVPCRYMPRVVYSIPL